MLSWVNEFIPVILPIFYVFTLIYLGSFSADLSNITARLQHAVFSADFDAKAACLEQAV